MENNTTTKHMEAKMGYEFKEINKKYFWYPLLLFSIGFFIGCMCGYSERKPTKKYPIEVQCYWSTSGYQSYPSMDADSIKGDTIYKDGLSIVNKNIVNVNFK